MSRCIRDSVSVHDVLIVGGGCVGCSVARSLAEKSNLDIALVEKEHHLATHQSGRNSGVLHPGFNYEPGSLKAEFAVRGTRQAKRYASENDIPMEEFGVLVVAQDDKEEERLEGLQDQAERNGVETTLLHGSEAIAKHEPHASGQAALHAPEAASIDSQQYVYSLARDAANAGVHFYTGTEFQRAVRRSDGFLIETSSGSLEAEYVVNTAGLHADTVASEFGIGEGLQVIPFRGEYYEIVPEKREVCETMIYPTPDPELPFLGVHYTRRTDDKVIVGPNAVLAFGREAYSNSDISVTELAKIFGYRGFRRLMANPKMLKVGWDELNKSYRKAKFVAAAQRLVPDVQADDFRRSYSGIRAQLVTADGTLVKEPLFEHGERSTHVLNAVSPGLTCSLPFGDYLSDEVIERY